jgi:hypothetical protein
MPPSAVLKTLIEYTTLTAKTVQNITEATQVPFLAATAALTLAILECVDVSRFFMP